MAQNCSSWWALSQRSATTLQVNSKTLGGHFWFSCTIKNCPIPNHCAETMAKVAGPLDMKEEPPPPPSPWDGSLVGKGYEMEEMGCYLIRRLLEMWISTWVWGDINTYIPTLIALFCVCYEESLERTDWEAKGQIAEHHSQEADSSMPTGLLGTSSDMSGLCLDMSLPGLWPRPASFFLNFLGWWSCEKKIFLTNSRSQDQVSFRGS